MKNGWFDRLVEAIDESGTSRRSLSISAGRGPNFVQQMISNRKQPGIDNLIAILDQLGTEVTIYVLTGVRISPGGLEMLEAINRLNPEARESATHFFAALQADEDTPMPEIERGG